MVLAYGRWLHVERTNPVVQQARPLNTRDGSLLFGPFTLNRASAQLTRDGQTVPLTPKAYVVLAYLAEHAGRLLTKQELIDAAWADVFVGDAALKVCIREIRRALDDDVHKPAVHRDRAPARLSLHRAGHRRGLRAGGAVRARVVARPAASGPPVPTTHYARSGDVNIAYQVIGDGPIDLVFVMGWVSHLECFWTEPSFARFLRRLAELLARHPVRQAGYRASRTASSRCRRSNSAWTTCGR